ncbi:GNAT family N-acetyltransferase, partial [Streptomyces sp. MBT55]|uniref:GNAT family N-acetyltransferase n=1 Tax=Streptomyces sp. MBT55 TaxID=1488386 RepID=UPI00191300D1
PAPEPATAPEPAYRVSLATCQKDVRAAQRLRHLVFAGELGARLEGPEPGLDSDAFDAYCDHLLVRETATGDVVATYRLLPPDRARIAGRLYAESEFDLSNLDAIRDDLVEVGRSCVHPAHHCDASAHGPEAGSRADLPPLLRGYLRLGAQVCGAPAYDPDFNVADLYVLLSLRRTDPRYLRHFLSLAPLR